jgi:hypothetical protein
MKLIVKCDYCNNDLEIYPSQKRYKTHFCNIECKSNYQKNKKLSKETRQKISKKTSGKNNGMYGKTHTDETKIILSEKAKQNFENNPKLKLICGNSRLSKIELSKLGKSRASKVDYSKFIGRKLSNETKRKIGIKSKEKFTLDYKYKIRKKFEETGKWISLNKKEDYLLYKDLANWNDKIFDKVNDENQIKLLNENGVFNVYKNSKGVVRDHMYSRWSGFNNKVFPELLRHPSNCEILLHADNLRKKRGWNTDKDSMTLDELFVKIQKYKKWKEQNLCLDLINKYKSGERYNKQIYIQKYYERH